MPSPSIWELTKTALDTLGVPVAANVYIAATNAELPDLYLVYFLVSSTPEQHADNVEKIRGNRVQVSAFTRTTLATLPDVSAAMVAAGFARGPTRELPYSQQTRHFGLAMDFIYVEES